MVRCVQEEAGGPLTKGAAELLLRSHRGQSGLRYVALVQVHIGHALQERVAGIVNDLCPQEGVLNLLWHCIVFKVWLQWDGRYGNLESR